MPEITIASPSTEQAFVPAAPASTAPTIESAHTFLDDLRQSVSPAAYTAFLDTMRMYKRGYVSHLTVVVLCKALLRDSADLTRGFMAFVGEAGQNEGEQNAPPPLTTITRDAEVLLQQPRVHYYPFTRRTGVGTPSGSPQAVTGARRAGPRGAPDNDVDRAIRFVTSVKARFSSSPQTYKDFLSTLHKYQKNSTAQGAMKKVISRVAILFADHADLRESFVYFLPDKAQARARHALGLEVAVEGDTESESAPESAAEGSASEGAPGETAENAETLACGGGREESAQPEQIAVAGE